MPDFSQRSRASEIMDDFTLSKKEIDPVLKELEVINKLLGGFSVFRDAFKQIPLANGNRICDWGCGGGDSLRELKRYFQKKNMHLEYIGIDATPAAIDFARQRHGQESDISFRLADVLKEDFKEAEYDVVISSLFTHHFDDEQWVDLVKRMLFNAKKAVVINDLYRHWFAWHAIGWLTQLFSKSYMIRHDSKLSVLRGFTKKELEMLLQSAGIQNYRLKWMWAFRWQLIIYK